MNETIIRRFMSSVVTRLTTLGQMIEDRRLTDADSVGLKFNTAPVNPSTDYTLILQAQRYFRYVYVRPQNNIYITNESTAVTGSGLLITSVAIFRVPVPPNTQIYAQALGGGSTKVELMILEYPMRSDWSQLKS